MKVIEVKEYDPPIAQEYATLSYPGPGIYYIVRLGYYAVVGNSVTMVIAPMGSLGEKEIEEGKKAPDELATLLAIALHANAAEAYVRKS